MRHPRPARILVALRWLPLLLLIASSAPADTAPGFAPERRQFLEALERLRADDWEGLAEHAAALRHYPLHPYLRYWELRRRLHEVSGEAVAAFLSAHGDLPVAPRLRAAWLQHLADTGRWSEYAAFYDGEGHTELRCHYLNALLETGRRQEALAQVEPLWLAAHSQPKACDPVFAAWRAAGALTPERVWARLSLSMEAGDTRMVRYLARFLPPEEQQAAERWLAVRRAPGQAVAQVPPDSTHAAQIVAYGVRRLARREPAAAAQAWSRLQENYRFDGVRAAAVERTVARAMAFREHPDAAQWLRLAAATDPELGEWAVREALRRNDWADVAAAVAELDADRRGRPQWRYWEARAAEALGDTAKAEAGYAALSAERDYFGFLAADRLGTRYRLQHRPLEVSAQELAAMEQRDAILRARELLRIGRNLDARREWYAATRDMGRRELLAAAKLAQRWGWHDRAILTVARGGHLDDLELRFPVAFRDAVTREAGSRRLDPAWVFATLRQESAFAADARSPAGAMGLMQLMPRTARQVARALDERAPSRQQLLQPNLNIRLGTEYLSRVLKRLDDNPLLASAAYNAGPHRVRSWRPQGGTMDADVWAETIPFRETRRYVRRVFAYTPIYEARMGLEITPLERRMPSVRPEGGGVAEP